MNKFPLKVTDHVYQHKYHLVSNLHYDLDAILGVFPFGSMNYGLFEDQSDIDTKVIYLPTYREVVFDKPISQTYKIGEEFTEVKDIRLMVDMWKKQNINFVEILFAEGAYINPKYNWLWQDCFYPYRESIAHYNPDYFYMSVCGQARHHLKQLRQEYNGKKACQILRLYYTLKKYDAGESYQKSIYFGPTLIRNYNHLNCQPELLLAYKHENKILSVEEINQLYIWFDTFPDKAQKHTRLDIKQKLDDYFTDLILVSLKEREITSFRSEEIYKNE